MLSLLIVFLLPPLCGRSSVVSGEIFRFGLIFPHLVLRHI
uniref:Uncharacterized protein n=1 Tax=Arundo donax TaxID=35708 RepID=A0A0A9ELU4_ARUDO